MMSHLDPHINHCELEDQRIIHLQKLVKSITKCILVHIGLYEDQDETFLDEVPHLDF